MNTGIRDIQTITDRVLLNNDLTFYYIDAPLVAQLLLGVKSEKPITGPMNILNYLHLSGIMTFNDFEKEWLRS